MSTLDVWVARPGSACRVDDNDWQVRVEDAHGQPYKWAGTSYAWLPAPNAHWAGAIPPGTYVVSAWRVAPKAGEPNRAESAIVEVGCVAVACVRLFVGMRPSRDPKPPDKPPDDKPSDDKPPKPPDDRPKNRGSRR
jgi:hypothetical protein